MNLEELREQVATACRVLADEGLVESVLGHVSARAGDRMLLRCRGPREHGLRFTT
ncbi:MAG TPA: class II aldolase/adducin family protein, partial [Actinomycetota bacterium]|nr:class II aldolase/adducin family protein [Actinomycetota bacterium]